jgi:hypothetical protein
VLGAAVLGAAVLGAAVLGAAVLGAAVLGAAVLGAAVLGAAVRSYTLLVVSDPFVHPLLHDGPLFVAHCSDGGSSLLVQCIGYCVQCTVPAVTDGGSSLLAARRSR